MRPHIPLWPVPLLCLALAALNLHLVRADEPVIRDQAVLDRQETMRTAKDALTVLSDMSALRMTFDRIAARDARHRLRQTVSDIPARFEHPHMDAHTRARRAIWQNREDFNRKAEQAQRAARRIRTNSLKALRRSLPDMVGTCLSCHNTYREDR